MSDKTSNENEKSPSIETTPLQRPTSNSNTQIPTPPPSHHNQETNNDELDDDYSELSAESQERRQRRGGRKQKQFKRPAQRLQSVSEFDVPTSSRRAPARGTEEHDESQLEEDEDDVPSVSGLAPPVIEEGEDYDGPLAGEEDEYEAEERRKAQATKAKRKEEGKRPKARNRSTGISALSIERPRGGGRRPPLSVSVERDGEKVPGSEYKSKKGKAKKKVESEEDSEDEEERKPVQIRLDLNLEVEILFKTKIKGDVTITFL
jgi:hypothetical protein